MKATAKYVINIEVKGDDEEDTVGQCYQFVGHLRRMMEMYCHIGSVHIDGYWIGDSDDPDKQEEEE